VWTYDIPRKTLTRLTFEGRNNAPTWTPDGKRVAFESDRAEGPGSLFWKSADGSGMADQLTTSQQRQVPQSWSPDGKLLAFSEVHPTSNGDIWVLPLEGEREPQLFLQTPFNETLPVFSPDGHWLAYRSNESGRNEVYVQPYPGPGGKWQISTEGGTEPLWARNGGELFYLNGEQMMAVDITTQPGFSAGTPHLLFEGQYHLQAGTAPASYAVTADGQQFIMIKAAAQARQINVVLNWFEELKRLVPIP
jgi:Tol biopolymer transport system component